MLAIIVERSEFVRRFYTDEAALVAMAQLLRHSSDAMTVTIVGNVILKAVPPAFMDTAVGDIFTESQLKVGVVYSSACAVISDQCERQRGLIVLRRICCALGVDVAGICSTRAA